VKIAVLGAAGRDFHDFLVLYRDDPHVEVVAFTATQIPYITDRRFPAALAGPRYPEGIPIVPEEDLERLVAEEGVEQLVFAYSDVTVQHVASLTARATAAGADLVQPGSRTMLPSRRPVIGVGAVRTGCGKSQVTHWVTQRLVDQGLRAVAIRHPMPYGDLEAQAVQRFATREDLDRHQCTIEEREEYEPYLERGLVVYAGVDYARILAAAEEEADVILWDGGNNDLPLIRPDLHLVLLDAHRPGHAWTWVPSEAQVRMADVVLIAKADTASAEAVAGERALAAELAPGIPVVAIGSEIQLEGCEEASLAGKRVVCVEDGPTTTHGGMTFGAASLLAQRAGAVVVDPRPHLVGEIDATYASYPDLGPLVPAMGYSDQQQADLEASLRASPADVVLNGSPIDLGALIDPGKPMYRVRYTLGELPGEPSLGEIVDAFLAEKGLG